MEIYYLAKVELFERIAKAFPDEFLADLANGYKMLVSIYGTAKNTQKCTAYLNKALPLFQMLTKQNEEKYSPNLEVLCLNAFELTYDYSWMKKAQHYALINPQDIESTMVLNVIKAAMPD